MWLNSCVARDVLPWGAKRLCAESGRGCRVLLKLSLFSNLETGTSVVTKDSSKER